MTLIVRPSAQLDIDEALSWYYEPDPTVAQRLFAELDVVFEPTPSSKPAPSSVERPRHSRCDESTVSERGVSPTRAARAIGKAPLVLARLESARAAASGRDRRAQRGEWGQEHYEGTSNMQLATIAKIVRSAYASG